MENSSLAYHLTGALSPSAPPFEVELSTLEHDTSPLPYSTRLENIPARSVANPSAPPAEVIVSQPSAFNLPSPPSYPAALQSTNNPPPSHIGKVPTENVEQLRTEEPPPYQPPTRPPEFPKYALEHRCVAAKAGDSPALHFTVTSTPPLPENTRHTLTHENGQAVTSRFKVFKDKILFCNVCEADSGRYIISCCNTAGLAGTETLELKVTPRYSNIHNQATDVHSQDHKENNHLCLVFLFWMMSLVMGHVFLWTLPCSFISLTYLQKACLGPAQAARKNAKKSVIWNGIAWGTAAISSVLILAIVLGILL